MLGLEKIYAYAEQLILALVMAVRKLRPYFQVYTVVVLITQPLHLILIKTNISGRMVRWLIKSSEFDLKFQPRIVIKAQTLVEFTVKKAQQKEM